VLRDASLAASLTGRYPHERLMIVPGDHVPDLDALLVEFEEADGAVRALYR
jgi:hypothetical protein